MRTVTTNIGDVTGKLLAKMRNLQVHINDKVVRIVANSALAEIKNRIHEEGQRADGSQMGTYSNPYLKQRQRTGKSWDTDPKVTLKLTGQMNFQFAVIATEKGYGLGWLDAGGGSSLSKKNKSGSKVSNFDKANFAELRFGKVYALTTKEEATANRVANHEVQNLLTH